jgi:hypothetical protein
MLSNKSKTKAIEGLAIAAEFYQSKLKPKAFCAQKNIPYHVLKYWRDRCKEQSGTSELHQVKFLPVKIVQAESRLQPPTLKIMLSDSLAIEVPNGADLLQLKKVLEVCRACG